MIPAPLAADETERLAALHRYDILDTPPEEFYDRLTRLAAEACQVPIALLSLVDADRQWFKSRVGLDASETPRDLAFCAHAILQSAPLVVNDATRDPRFADNPLVTGAPDIRFYAGVPLLTPGNLALGTLCVIDRKPRQLEPHQLTMLKLIAEQVSRELELRLLATRLQRESTLLSKFKSAAGIGGWSMDLRSRAVFWTDEMYQIHGVTRQAYAPALDSQLGLYDQGSASALRAAIEESAVGGTGFDLELSVVGGTGSVRWLRAMVEPQSLPGEVPHLFGVFHDITAQKRDALALDRSTARMAVASAAVGLALFEWTLWDNRLYWDEPMYRMYGRTSSGAEEPYSVWTSTLHPDDRAHAEEECRLAIEFTGRLDHVFRIVGPGGEVRVIREMGQTVQEPGTDRKRIIGFNQDITEVTAARQTAEAMLKANEHKFRTLFEMSPIGKVLLDLESGRILQANNALIEPTQFSREEVLEQSIWNLLPAEYHALYASIERQVREVERVGPLEVEMLRRDGSRYPVLLSSLLLQESSGRNVLWCIVQDISQSMAAATQLSDAARRDRLTGLANRTLFMEQLELALVSVRNGGQGHFALLFLDFDRFKFVNDTLGHEAGDPFDIIKIDRSFVRDLPANQDVLAVIHATVNLIENLGMTSLAEGVETPAQAAVLQSLGCRRAQGYVFSRPVLPGQMLATIAKINDRPLSAGQSPESSRYLPSLV